MNSLFIFRLISFFPSELTCIEKKKSVTLALIKCNKKIREGQDDLSLFINTYCCISKDQNVINKLICFCNFLYFIPSSVFLSVNFDNQKVKIQFLRELEQN